jgi:hypothetical protein
MPQLPPGSGAVIHSLALMNGSPPPAMSVPGNTPPHSRRRPFLRGRPSGCRNYRQPRPDSIRRLHTATQRRLPRGRLAGPPPSSQPPPPAAHRHTRTQRNRPARPPQCDRASQSPSGCRGSITFCYGALAKLPLLRIRTDGSCGPVPMVLSAARHSTARRPNREKADRRLGIHLRRCGLRPSRRKAKGLTCP